MPNNPLPTPTPPNTTKNTAPTMGTVPQGAVPKVAPNIAQKPTTQPAPVVTSKPNSSGMPNAAAPSVVTPGQIKPPVATVKSPTPQPNTVSSQPTSTSPSVATPPKVTTPPKPAVPSQSASTQAPSATVQPAPVQQPPARPTTAPTSVVTPPTAGLPKPGQTAVKPVVPAPSPAISTPGAVTTGNSVSATPVAATSSSPAPAVGVKKPPLALFAIIGVVIFGVIGFVLYSMFGTQPTKQSANTAQSGTNQAQTNTGANSSGAKTTTKPTTDKQTTITYWGLWEPTEVLSQVISDFEKANPQYKIDYRKQSHRDYRERLQTAIASGNGPDIFRFHASWTPMLQGELSPMPSSVMSDAEYKKVFYPVAAKQLSVKGRIVGIPLMYDGLALFYNVEILKTANAEPPQNWAELRSLADALTSPAEKSARGNAPLQRSGLAIGNAENVEHFSDILGLLILQNGGDLAKPNSAEVRDALLFYTNFIKEDMVWSDALPSSTVAFARGDAAMMLAPSWRAHDVKNLNPNLEFGVAPAPKLGDTRLGWATYWAEGVNVKSKNQEGAWAFLKYLSTPDVLKKLYADASQVRSFGEIYPRQDMAAELNDDAIASQFLVDATTADAWYVSSYTHDNGINDQLIKYYKDAVNSILAGQTSDEVIEALEAGTTQVLRQYNATE